MSAVEGVGDHHPGHRVPFWQQACQRDARNACANLAVILDTYCRDGSGWACNEVGALRWHRRVKDPERASEDFSRACGLGFQVACQNVLLVGGDAGPPSQARPQWQDYPVILRTGKGTLPDQTPFEFALRACDQGWMTGCDDLGAAYLQGLGTPRDPIRAAAAFEKACNGRVAVACSNLGFMHYSGDGLPRDEVKGVGYLKQACELGMPNACRWLSEVRPQ
jgi:TPR repeat protein